MMTLSRPHTVTGKRNLSKRDCSALAESTLCTKLSSLIAFRMPSTVWSALVMSQ